MAGGSLVCVSKVGPPANQSAETQSDSHPSVSHVGLHLPASSPPEAVWQRFGDGDDCNALIRSIRFEDVDSVEV